MPGEVVIDTSSLIDLARHIMPFDNESVISQAMQEQYASGMAILLPDVVDEIQRAAGGIVLKKLPF